MTLNENKFEKHLKKSIDLLFYIGVVWVIDFEYKASLFCEKIVKVKSYYKFTLNLYFLSIYSKPILIFFLI